MKYSELISFSPIESTIQLVESNRDKQESIDLVKTYVMSDSMAENLQAPVIDQIQMEQWVDNKGILVIGNYGTGKSHLMSVISAVANDAENLQYLQNKKFAEAMKPVAGKFEILRIEIGGVTMSLREILFGFIQEDFDERGIDFEVPEFNTVRDNKKLIKDMMIAFSEKYPDKGYLIVVDEFLSYLTSRNEREIVLDLEFMRALGEMCSKSNLRVMFGVQEKIFDNPKFSFVSDTLMHVRDRFAQVSIKGEDTAYVVSERILKKTPEQKAMIREHLEKFCSLYEGMSSRLEQFVDLFPIHPSYIDVFNKLYLIENRHVLKNISLVIRGIFNEDVPANAPGIFSFDSYWPAIKSDGLLKTDPAIGKVVDASSQLEEIINRAFPKPFYKPLAIKIIYALSVHRLQNNDLSLRFGMTAENLRDDLCLYLPLAENDADFLLGVISATLRDIMSTVSGQFMIHDEGNNQYYIDVNKVVDYDEKIKQKATLLDPDELNRYFYQVTYSCLEWEKKQYVPGFNIYEYDLNWQSHSIFREGYLFMGLPGERSTAQPERDFYIHIMPPYGNGGGAHDLPDEVYFYFKSTDDFKETLSYFAAANALAAISEGSDKEAYQQKANMLNKKLVKHLSSNKNTCFDVVYKKEKRQLIEILKGKYNPESTFGDTIELAASICLDDYLNSIYPEFPVMKTKITRRNMAENVRAAFDHFAGRVTQQSTMMLQSFGILDNENKIRPEGSKYALHYIDQVKALSAQGVINFSDIFETKGLDWQADKTYHIWNNFMPIIFLSMVYGGYAVITLNNGDTITTANLDKVPKISVMDLYEFKYLSKPAQLALAELKKLFEMLDLNPAELDNPNDRKTAAEKLVKAAQDICNTAVVWEKKLSEGFELWGEPLVNSQVLQNMQDACAAVKTEFSNYGSRFNSAPKLNNFRLTMEQLDVLKKNIGLVKRISEYQTFRTDCAEDVSYISSIEYIDLGDAIKSEIETAKAAFREIRDGILDGSAGDAAAEQVAEELGKVKAMYSGIYFDTHKKKRLGIKDAKRRGEIQEDQTLSKLRKLRDIDILSGAKLTEIEQGLASLKVCYELTPEELKTSPFCPHCHFSLADNDKNVYGQLDHLEDRIDALKDEWTRLLLDTIRDPLVLCQKEYLSAEQAKVIDDFIATGSLPDRVDDFFVSSIQALLKNYEPVIITVEDLMQKLEQLPPMDEDAFKAEIGKIISGYTKDKDAATLRIVVKRKDSNQ